MKKLFSILLLFVFLFLAANISDAAVNSYDQYGRKTGSYKTGSNGVTTKYDQYGRKTGSFKKDSSGRITEYDRYGRKVGSYK